MFNGRRIKDLLDERKITKVSLYRAIKMSKKGLDNIIDNVHVPKISNIEAIADFFHIPIDDLFDREVKPDEKNIGHQVKGNGNRVSGNITISQMSTEIEYLKNIIKEKEDVIKEKERTIKILMKQNTQ